MKKNFFVVQSWTILFTIVEIFCSSVKFFVQSGNILFRMQIFCDVWKYFVQCVNILHKCGNIQSGKVQIYAATEFFKSHSTEMGVDMQIDRASIHLLSPSTTSTQPESSHQQEFEWNNVKL